jgi:hypothetical protein
MKGRKLVAYCTLCAGDVFDGVQHRCPPRRIAVDEIIRLKRTVAAVKARFSARPLWPPSMQPLYDDLNGALDDMTAGLARFEKRGLE